MTVPKSKKPVQYICSKPSLYPFIIGLRILLLLYAIVPCLAAYTLHLFRVLALSPLYPFNILIEMLYSCVTFATQNYIACSLLNTKLELVSVLESWVRSRHDTAKSTAEWMCTCGHAPTRRLISAYQTGYIMCILWLHYSLRDIRMCSVVVWHHMTSQ